MIDDALVCLLLTLNIAVHYCCEALRLRCSRGSWLLSWLVVNQVWYYTKLALETATAQKIKFSIKDFFNKCDQIRMRKSLLKKFLVEIFTFCAVYVQQKNYGGIKNLGLWRHGIYDVTDFSGFKQISGP